MGYLLKDKAMIDRGESGITYTIAHAAPNGKLGNPKIESLWPMVVFFRAMKAYYESGNHPEAVAALEKHYLSLTPSDLTNGSRHILNIEGILRIYGKTGNKLSLRSQRRLMTREVLSLTPCRLQGKGAAPSAWCDILRDAESAASALCLYRQTTLSGPGAQC